MIKINGSFSKFSSGVIREACLKWLAAYEDELRAYRAKFIQDDMTRSFWNVFPAKSVEDADIRLKSWNCKYRRVLHRKSHQRVLALKTLSFASNEDIYLCAKDAKILGDYLPRRVE